MTRLFAALAAALLVGLALCASPAAAQSCPGYAANVRDCAGVLYTHPNGGASGITPVTGALSTSTRSSTFAPQAGRSFNASVWGTFVGTLTIDRSFDAGVTWLPITSLGTSVTFSAPFTEVVEEPEVGVIYSINFTRTSGTANVRLSQ